MRVWANAWTREIRCWINDWVRVGGPIWRYADRESNRHPNHALCPFVFRDLFNTEITKIFTKGTEENPASSVATFSSIEKISSVSESLVNRVNWYFHTKKSVQ